MLQVIVCDDCGFSSNPVDMNELSPDLLARCMKCGSTNIDIKEEVGQPEAAQQDKLKSRHALVRKVEADDIAAVKRILGGVHVWTRGDDSFLATRSSDDNDTVGAKRFKAGRTAVHFEASIKPEDIELIRAPDGETGRSLVHHVQSMEMLQLLSNQINPPLITDLNAQDAQGRTRLHRVYEMVPKPSRARSQLTVGDLVRKGCDPTVRSSNGQTAYEELAELVRKQEARLQSAEQERRRRFQEAERQHSALLDKYSQEYGSDRVRDGAFYSLKHREGRRAMLVMVQEHPLSVAKKVRDKEERAFNDWMRVTHIPDKAAVAHLKGLRDELDQHPGGATFHQLMDSAHVSFSSVASGFLPSAAVYDSPAASASASGSMPSAAACDTAACDSPAASASASQRHGQPPS